MLISRRLEVGVGGRLSEGTQVKGFQQWLPDTKLNTQQPRLAETHPLLTPVLGQSPNLSTHLATLSLLTSWELLDSHSTVTLNVFSYCSSHKTGHQAFTHAAFHILPKVLPYLPVHQPFISLFLDAVFFGKLLSPIQFQLGAFFCVPTTPLLPINTLATLYF